MSGHTSIFSATEPPLSTVTETPTSVRHNTRALTFKHLNLEDKRTAVCLDMNPSIRIVPLAYFFDNVLPALHEDIDITSVIQTLQDSGVIEEERFQDFSSDPAQMPGHENIVFARLEKIVRDMVEAAETATLKPTMEFYHKGECSPKNATTPNKSRPDSFGLLRAMIIAGIRWINIGFTGEVKKIFNDKKRHDNDRKTAWSMHRSLRDDAHRRFTFAFTIENTQMRLWHCNRQTVLISEEFNFITDYPSTIRFFLSLMFARPHQIGWDPTMEQLPDGQFDITVRSSSGENRRFRTQALLAEDTETILGKGSRVWQVLALNGHNEPTGPLLTLKDSWIDYDRPREGDVFHTVRNVDPSTSHHMMVDTFFAHVISHGDVRIEQEGCFDNTELLMLNNMPVPEDSLRYEILPPLENDTAASIGFRRPFQSQAITRFPQVHYRIVYEDSCKPLSALTDLRQILMALSQASGALRSLHHSGWVHRDLNLSSILLDDDLTVRLAHLESAKRIDSTSPAHPGRIATKDFVAVEVLEGQYHFFPMLTEHAARPAFQIPEEISFCDRLLMSRNDMPDQVVELEASDEDSSSVVRSEDAAFRYNPLHDLESLWWTAVYFLFRGEVGINGVVRGPSQGQLEYSAMLFGPGSSLARRTALQSPSNFSKALVFINPFLRNFGHHLELIRVQLVKAYVAAECGMSAINLSVVAGLHGYIGTTFMKLSQQFAHMDISLHMSPRDSDDDDDLTYESDSNIPAAPHSNMRHAPPTTVASASKIRKRGREDDDSNLEKQILPNKHRRMVRRKTKKVKSSR